MFWRKKKKLPPEQNKLQGLRQQAENPDTTGNALVKIAETLGILNGWQRYTEGEGLAVLEAVAAHPNTPPLVLKKLVSYCPAAFCRNPIAPLVLLEDPAFIADLDRRAFKGLWREPAAPPALLHAISRLPPSQQGDAFAYPHHVAIAGVVQSQDEWNKGVEQYWRAVFASIVARIETQWGISYDERLQRQFVCDLAELGLAPQWTLDAPYFVDPLDNAPTLPPEGQEWLRFAHGINAPVTRSLWEQIAPGFKNLPYHFAHCLRADASPADLLLLADRPEGWKGCVRSVITCHPSADATITKRLRGYGWGEYMALLTLGQPALAPSRIAELTQSKRPDVRRAARRHPNAPLNAEELSRQAVLRHVKKNPEALPPFVQFCLLLRGAYRPDLLRVRYRLDSDTIDNRLICALSLPASLTPVPDDPGERTFRDLLSALSHDANRLVRWAAQKRLADPDFRFCFDNDEPIGKEAKI